MIYLAWTVAVVFYVLGAFLMNLVAWELSDDRPPLWAKLFVLVFWFLFAGLGVFLFALACVNEDWADRFCEWLNRVLPYDVFFPTIDRS